MGYIPANEGVQILHYSAEQIQETFNKASLAFPELAKGATPLSMGMFGLVLEHEDTTITKIMFRPKDEYWFNLAKTHTENEITALRLFTEYPLEGVVTPSLIGEPTILDNQDYLGYYQISKLPGERMWWYPQEGQRSDSVWLKRGGEEAGHLLAKFHRAALNIPSELLMGGKSTKNGKISQVEMFSDETNRALAKADTYLQEHKIAGVIHGDFHGGNIMVNPNNEVTGVIDFGFTSQSENIFYDFMNAKEEFMPSLIHGYEQESGQNIDRHVITASLLGKWVDRFIKMSEGDLPDKKKAAITKIHGYLNDLAPVIA